MSEVRGFLLGALCGSQAGPCHLSGVEAIGLLRKTPGIPSGRLHSGFSAGEAINQADSLLSVLYVFKWRDSGL